MSTPERQKYKIAGPATWELIRAAYLGGESAPALAERFGVSEAAIRKRISKEKWTKRDYAAALEARGLSLPAKPAANFIDEGVIREEARRRGEAAAAEARDAEIHAWIEQVAAEEEAASMADALERRALAQAGAAMVQGKAKEAQALAALAEQMRKRTGAAVTSVAAPQQQREPERAQTDFSEEQRIDFVTDMFSRAAFLAGAMVHQPWTAPAAFVRLIKEWRMINLGEGEADAEAAARRTAKAQEHYINGNWIDTMPAEVREHLHRRWAETCAREEAKLVEGAQGDAGQGRN
jgi:hypothetical protein